jgi:mitochondrial inner membrane protease ATP23
MSDRKPEGAPASSPNDPQLDRTYYTWSTIFKVLAGLATKEEVDKYNAVDDVLKREKRCNQCEEEVNWLYQYSKSSKQRMSRLTAQGPMVRFMRAQINGLGVDVPRDRVVCVPCTNPTNPGVTGGLSNKPKASGGIDPDYGIVLCANLVTNRKDREDTLTHEMVHMYDYVRFKFDRTNLRHMACTEVARLNALERKS